MIQVEISDWIRGSPHAAKEPQLTGMERHDPHLWVILRSCGWQTTFSLQWRGNVSIARWKDWGAVNTCEESGVLEAVRQK